MSSPAIDQAAMQPPRFARLVLVTPDGAVVGALPEIPVALPWWQDAETVVRAARDYHSVDVTILRLLETARDTPHGGAVTYLAEVQRPRAKSLSRPNRGTGGLTGTRCGTPMPSPADPPPTLPGRNPCSMGAASHWPGRRSRYAAGTCRASGASRSPGRPRG